MLHHLKRRQTLWSRLLRMLGFVERPGKCAGTEAVYAAPVGGATLVLSSYAAEDRWCDRLLHDGGGHVTLVCSSELIPCEASTTFTWYDRNWRRQDAATQRLTESAPEPMAELDESTGHFRPLDRQSDGNELGE